MQVALFGGRSWNLNLQIQMWTPYLMLKVGVGTTSVVFLKQQKNPKPKQKPHQSKQMSLLHFLKKESGYYVSKRQRNFSITLANLSSA